MDNKNEEIVVHDIERSLSNHMSENLFLSGRDNENRGTLERIDKSRSTLERKENHSSEKEELKTTTGYDKNSETDYPLVSNEYISNNFTGISRAEYIRQAREACLRQLSEIQLYSRPYEINYMEPETSSNDQLNQKKARVMKLFHNENDEEAVKNKTNTGREAVPFRSVIIRSVCAIVIFISIFMVDKFDIQVGNITNKAIQEYVTGNDALKQIENILVGWLK